jgi:hypothetical protein
MPVDLVADVDAFARLLHTLDFAHFPSLKKHRHYARNEQPKNRLQASDLSTLNALQKSLRKTFRFETRFSRILTWQGFEARFVS